MEDTLGVTEKRDYNTSVVTIFEFDFSCQIFRKVFPGVAGNLDTNKSSSASLCLHIEGIKDLLLDLCWTFGSLVYSWTNYMARGI